VFERFYRGQSPSRGKTRGSGIGLSLVKHIAEAHGGRAWAENANDGGAIVGISLPRRDPSQRLTAPQARPESSIDTPERTDIVARHG
jgi:two-component system OmpR family sensor kinase